MGIRFLCEHCQKRVHVKDFLAGKRARCPHCKESMQIPLESTLVKEKSAVADTRDSPAAGKSVADTADAKPKSEIRSDVHMASAKQASKHETADLPATAETAKQEMVATPPVNPAPLVDEHDPFAEAPNALWYVAPPQGGQYGPADNKMLQSWIEEGRVSSDSMIWREGWPDWRSATTVMRLPSSSPPPPAPTTSTQSPGKNEAQPAKGDVHHATHSESSVKSEKSASKYDALPSMRYQRARNRSRTLGIILIASLGIISIVLVVVLIIVLQNNG
jgi:hypothetical protein